MYEIYMRHLLKITLLLSLLTFQSSTLDELADGSFVSCCQIQALSRFVCCMGTRLNADTLTKATRMLFHFSFIDLNRPRFSVDTFLQG